ncbi:hypothetical protein MLD38_031228 [Melastoma candidum]|uniref:Uncharacterized protein n=1 Tax=Melastoma candidum TaxID=119954 RepID=A0ACB9MR00_9MYRT|nr:hypothetical protein MLD38_031228 [Melastoma candidum]
MMRNSEGKERTKPTEGKTLTDFHSPDSGHCWDSSPGVNDQVQHARSPRRLHHVHAPLWCPTPALPLLVKHERFETMVPKAKEVRRLADNMVQLGKEAG